MNNKTIPPYSVNDSGWTFFVNNRPMFVAADSPNFARVAEAVAESDYDALIDLLTEDKFNSAFRTLVYSDKDGCFKIVSNDEDDYAIQYTDDDGKVHVLPDVLCDKLVNLYQQKVDMTRYVNFVRNVYLNPRPDSITELFDFLSYKELPITQNGTFIAYKGVQNDLFSITANTETRVLKGDVKHGKIKNALNSEIEVHIDDVDPDRRKHCSNGLHVGSYHYAADFGSTVLAVEVNPKDVVSVPTDYSCQKCRVAKYKVLSIVESEFTGSSLTVDNDNGTIDDSMDLMVDENDVASASDILLSAENIADTREAIERNVNNHQVLTLEYEDGSEKVKVYSSELTEDDLLEDDPNMSDDSLEFYKINVPATTISQLCGSVGRKDGVTRGAMFTVLMKLGYRVILNQKSLGNSIVEL